LLVAGGLRPAVLSPVHGLWMTLGYWMGWFNSRIILGLFFYGTLTPIGVVVRLVGQDFMRMKTASVADTYRLVRTARSPTHVRHQF
jgi:hypothetical protein